MKKINNQLAIVLWVIGILIPLNVSFIVFNLDFYAYTDSTRNLINMLIPASFIFSLLFCGGVVFSTKRPLAKRITHFLLTLIILIIQFGILIFILMRFCSV